MGPLSSHMGFLFCSTELPAQNEFIAPFQKGDVNHRVTRGAHQNLGTSGKTHWDVS